MGASSEDQHIHEDAGRLWRHGNGRVASSLPSVVKEPSRLGLDDWHLSPRVGDIKHEIQRPTQQLG